MIDTAREEVSNSRGTVVGLECARSLLIVRKRLWLKEINKFDQTWRRQCSAGIASQMSQKMNQSTLSASMKRNYALALGRDEPTLQTSTQPRPMIKGHKQQSTKKIFEYRGSADLQINANFTKKQKNEDLNRVQTQLERSQGCNLMGSYGLSEIKSEKNQQKSQIHASQQSVDIVTKPSAYQMKRQQAHYRQNGKAAVGGIVGRRVDAPHIIVPSQGPVGMHDFENKEQGSITQSMIVQCQPGHSTVQLSRGRQTASLSPKNSPWKKSQANHGKSTTGSSHYAKSKAKNLFGQVKLCFNQGNGVSGGQGTSAQSRKAAQKNFKSQQGKHWDGTKNSRTSKSMEQVRHVQRQQANAPSHNTLKPFKNQEQNLSQMKKSGQQAAGRKKAMHGHYDRAEMQAESGKQRHPGATNRQQRSQLNNFLDQSMVQHPSGAERAGNMSSIQIQNQGSETAQNQITLNILTATADQFINQGGQVSTTDNTQHATGAKCKSAASRHNPNDQSRQLIQTKYLNFQREVHHNKKQDCKSVQQQRVNHHRTGGSRAKTTLANHAQTGGTQTRANSKGAVGNPFQRVSSSQGRASGSGGATSTGHSRAFGATKNQTIEIDVKRRSKSKQGTSGVLSDTPDKSQSQKRARSGGSSNNRKKQQLLGASASFSPRSRATTQFQEARSLLFENQSSGLSVNSKKHGLNQLLQIEGRQQKQKPSNAQGLAGSQQYIVAQTQSASVLKAQQSVLDPTYNISAVLLQAPTDPNNSVYQYLRVSNDNLRSNAAPETQVGDASQQAMVALAEATACKEDNRSAKSKKYAHLNASLGRILNQSALSHGAAGHGKKDGQSQSPKGSRGAQRGNMAQPSKGQIIVSASNTSRIDKIIQENLKKQGKKTMQRKIKEQQEEQVTRKKKAELEQVNERVRNANKEKVQRRKLQQMVLMQTNNTAKPGKSVKGNDTIADAIREEMTRMLDELPENAIVKSQKDKRANQENISLQQQQAAAQSYFKLTAVKDSAQPKQLQARTQKIDLKFSAQQRMEGLLGKLQKPTGNTQHGGAKEGHTKTKNREGLPPKQLIVNRLGQPKKEASVQQKSSVKQMPRQDYSIINGEQPINELEDIEDELFYHVGQSQGRIGGGRFKDHRKSYGLEFIDIRKEIVAEMKRVASRKSPRTNQGKQRKNRDNQRGSNLRCTGGIEKVDSSETGILMGGKNLRGSKSQRQVIMGQTARSTPALEETERNADLDVSHLLKDESVEHQIKVKILKPSQVNMTALRIRTGTDKKAEMHQNVTNGLGIVLKKEKIRKFMLKKQKEKLEKEEKSKMEEIQKTLKVHQNLLNLDKYAKKKWRVAAPSGGPRTGKASQSGTQGNTLRHHRNNLALRKNMTLVHDQPESDNYAHIGHNLTITPSKQAHVVTEPSFNISAKLNQRVSSKQLKRMTKATLLKEASNNGTQNIHIDPTITADFFYPEDQGSSTRDKHHRSTQSRGNDHNLNKSVNQQLAPQFENSTSAKTLRALIRSYKQTSSQSPPNFDISRTEPPHQLTANTSMVKSKSGARRGTQNVAKNSNNAATRSSQGGQPHAKQSKKGTATIKQQKKRGRSINRRSAGAGCTIQLNNKKLDMQLSAGTIAKLKSQQTGMSSANATQHYQHHIQLRPNHNNSLQRSSINTLESETHSRHQSGYLRHRMPSSLVSAQRLDRDLAAQIIQKEVRKYLKGIGFYQARQIDSPDRQPISLFIEKRSMSHSKKSKQSKSRSGSRGMRQQSPSLLQSPERGSLQETTIIAELSGLRQTDLFQDDVDPSDNEMQGYSEVKPHKASKQRSRDTPPQRRSGSQSRKNNRQKSSSSERETSSKYHRRQQAKNQQRPDKQIITSQQPHKQLNPVFKEINDGMNPVLHEILSVQTPQSRSSHPAEIKVDKPTQSVHSLSAHHMSESDDYEFKQAHSSVESSSIEKLGLLAQNGQLPNDVTSQSSNSLFDRNAFQQYSQKKLQHIMQDSEHSKLIKFREDYLKYKEKKERRHIEKRFKQNEFSPRTFQLKQKQIDRWVQLQQQEIEKTKSTFIEEWEKTIQMIEDTQKNVDQMKSKMFLAPNSHHSNGTGAIASASQAASGAKPAANSQMNNFNSQSCNSLSSHRNYQRAHSNNANGNTGQHLALSNLGEHQRSILIEDPPKSYRSGRQEVSQIQILPINGNNSLPTEGAGEDGHGSIGVLSSRRSGNGPGENGNNQATTLLQYMEQRLQSHKEHKQTSLSELKSRTGNQRDEDDIKNAMDQIEIHGSTNLELPAKNERESMASSQKMAGLSRTLEKLHQRKPSAGSAALESENLSHQPSAEFLERLERVNKQEAVASQSAISDKLLGSGDFTALEDPLLGSALQSEVDPEALNNGGKPADPEDLLSQSDRHDRSNFKNQVMTIRDFSAIDSKRTSQQSETSNERDFIRMLANQQTKNDKNNDGLGEDNAVASPSAEHLEEPSIIGKRETQHSFNQDSAPGSEKESKGSTKTEDQLKDQQKDQQSSHRSDQNEQDHNLLQEPAIISSSQSLEVPNQTGASYSVFDPSNPNLVTAKTKASPEKQQINLGLSEIKTLFSKENEGKPSNTDQKHKILDQITEELIKSLVTDSLAVVPRGSESKESQQSAQSSSQNHDVYYIDQLQSEKEERKEWIELRQRHLIDNDLIRIDQYVNEIVDALLQFDIDLSMEEDEDLTQSQRELREKELKKNYHIQFLRQLTQPIQKSSADTLQTLQTSEIGSYKHFETTQDLQKFPIIPVNLYLDIEKAREEALLARKGSAMSKQTQMVWESIHIQNKSFFDAINESLMKFRPYGLTGEPMPWSNKIRRLQTKVDIGSVDTERLFQMVKQEVFRWAQAFCGSLPSPVFCFPSSQSRDKEDFSDELFQENREKRLTQVLSAETIEQEHHWLNYEYEEAQVKVDLSDMILEHLVDEIANFLNVQSGAVSEFQPPLKKPNDKEEESKVEIVELHDEPEFARSSELGAATAAEVNAYLAGPMDLGVGGQQSTNSLQKFERDRQAEA